jgi:hypothetical protein
LCGFRSIVPDRHPANTISPEEQRRRIKLRHHAAAPADDADPATIAKHRDHLVELGIPDVINGKVNLVWSDRSGR